MINELTKSLVCVQIRGDIQIWVEADRAKSLIGLLSAPNAPQFITYEERLINRADIVGVFTAKDMAEMAHRKKGEWKCGQNYWHTKFDKCDCYKKWDKFWKILQQSIYQSEPDSVKAHKEFRKKEEEINEKYPTFGDLLAADMTSDFIFEQEHYKKYE